MQSRLVFSQFSFNYIRDFKYTFYNFHPLQRKVCKAHIVVLSIFASSRILFYALCITDKSNSEYSSIQLGLETFLYLLAAFDFTFIQRIAI